MKQQRFYPMTIGQIIDLSFKVYKVNFLKFLAIVAIIQVPLTLVNLAIGMQVPTATGSAVNFGDAAPYVFSQVLISWLATLLSSAALIRGVSQYYLGDDVSVGGAYGNVVPKLLTLIGASILVGLVVMLGMVLFIIPGIIFMFWYTLTTQIRSTHRRWTLQDRNIQSLRHGWCWILMDYDNFGLRLSMVYLNHLQMELWGIFLSQQMHLLDRNGRLAKNAASVF